MLETVKRYIEDGVTDDAFSNFFTKYVLAVQDTNIELEMKYLTSHNVLDALKLNRLINSDMDRLVKTW